MKKNIQREIYKKRDTYKEKHTNKNIYKQEYI